MRSLYRYVVPNTGTGMEPQWCRTPCKDFLLLSEYPAPPKKSPAILVIVFCSVFMGTSRAIVIADADIARQVLIKDFNSFQARNVSNNV